MLAHLGIEIFNLILNEARKNLNLYLIDNYLTQIANFVIQSLNT